LINSIDMKKLLDLIAAKELAGVREYLLGEVNKLAQAGADFGLLASNTPHLVFADLQRQSPIPLISIVESACTAAQSLGLKKVGLLGTRFTMKEKFYPEVFEKQGIEIVLPTLNDQGYIHEKYMNELVNGVFLSETRERLLTIVERLTTQNGIQGLILGGTELPLIFRDKPAGGIPFLDTSRIHVERAISFMLG